MLIDYSGWEEYEGASEGSGRSDKIWLINKNTNEIGLFKFTKSDETKEHISEKLAQDIAELIGLECARIEIGTYQSREGCMSFLINKDRDILIEGIYLINKKYPFYNPETLYDLQYDEYYSLEMIINVLSEYNLVYDFLKIIIFDFIIGNTDRHQNNWAVLQNNNSIRMCPLYDNGSSLCCYISENNIDSYLGNDKMKFNSLVRSKSKSRIRINKKLRKEPTHIEVANYLKMNYNETSFNNWIEDVTSIITIENINSILNNYDDNIISAKRKKLLIMFLSKKVTLLKNIFLERGISNGC